LEKENIVSIHFRFQDAATPPLKTVVKKLGEYCGQPAAGTHEEKLWRLFKCCDFKGKMPLFVLDQFEEFFNHPKADREACIAELADLVNDYLPDYIRDEMREKFRETDPTETELKYYTPARVKMLFLIRADKLKLLDDLSKKIPLILRNRFHLKPLNPHQSEQAVLRPAALPPNGFASPTFTFQPEAVMAIANYLKNEEGEIESFQLQILCRELEKGVIDRAKKGETDLVVSEAHLGGEAGMDNITKNYYNNQLQSISDPAMKQKAVELIEDKLIVDERRISLPEVLLLSQGYSRELLDYLLNTTRLIRIDNDRYVEISHDRLLSSILKSRRQRVKEEERLHELEQLKIAEAEKEQKNLELQKVKRIKQRFLYFSIVLAILLVALAFTFLQLMKSDSGARIATLNYLIRQQAFTRADSIIESKRFSARFNFYNRDSLNKLEDSVKKEKRVQDQYLGFSTVGDSLLLLGSPLLTVADEWLDSLLLISDGAGRKKNPASSAYFKTVAKTLTQALGAGKLIDARNYYYKASATEFVPESEELPTAEKVLIDIDDKITYSFKQCIVAADLFKKANDWGSANEALQKGERIYALARDSTRPLALSNDDIAQFARLQNILKK
jgi:cell division protein FtsL